MWHLKCYVNSHIIMYVLGAIYLLFVHMVRDSDKRNNANGFSQRLFFGRHFYYSKLYCFGLI